MVVGMCIVGDALFQTGVAQKMGAKIAAAPAVSLCGCRLLLL